MVHAIVRQLASTKSTLLGSLSAMRAPTSPRLILALLCTRKRSSSWPHHRYCSVPSKLCACRQLNAGSSSRANRRFGHQVLTDPDGSHILGLAVLGHIAMCGMRTVLYSGCASWCLCFNTPQELPEQWQVTTRRCLDVPNITDTKVLPVCMEHTDVQNKVHTSVRTSVQSST